MHTATSSRENDTPSTGLDPLEICTLPASDRASRLAWIRDEILPHAISRERIAGGVALELRDAPGLAAKLNRLIELEAECCSSIGFAQRPSSVQGQRRLEVQGVDPNAPILQFPALSEPKKRGVGRRIGRAAGLGTLLSLFVCCVLPIGAAAILGASVAAPLASLDQPWVIAGSGLLFAAAAFIWQGRRTEKRTTSPDACGCD